MILYGVWWECVSIKFDIYTYQTTTCLPTSSFPTRVIQLFESLGAPHNTAKSFCQILTLYATINFSIWKSWNSGHCLTHSYNNEFEFWSGMDQENRTTEFYPKIFLWFETSSKFLDGHGLRYVKINVSKGKELIRKARRKPWYIKA